VVAPPRGWVAHPRCPQDSLLASPIILDLAILTELCQRVTFRTEADPEFQGFHSVLSIVAFLCKAPLVPEGTPVVNALFRQRSCIENILRYLGSRVHPPHPRLARLSRCFLPQVSTPVGPSAPCLWSQRSAPTQGVSNTSGCWCPALLRCPPPAGAGAQHF